MKQAPSFPPYPKPRGRAHFEVPSHVRALIEDLRKRTKADTLTEVVRRALTIYDALLTAARRGETIIARRKDGTECEVLLIP